MAEYVTKIRTEKGDMQIDYRALANLPDAPTLGSIGAAPKEHTHTLESLGAMSSDVEIPTKTSQLENDSGFKTTDNNTTYELSKSGNTITLTGSDGSTTSVTETDTTYDLSSFGITATAQELNTLDGITVTVDELNYCDGLSSNIQDQLDGKSASGHTHSYLPLSGGTLTGQLKIKTIVLTSGTSGVYGTSLPSAGTAGRLFFKKVSS